MQVHFELYNAVYTLTSAPSGVPYTWSQNNGILTINSVPQTNTKGKVFWFSVTYKDSCLPSNKTLTSTFGIVFPASGGRIMKEDTIKNSSTENINNSSQNSAITIFPNPVSDELSISLPESVNSLIEVNIMDIQDRLIEKKNISGKQRVLKVSVGKISSGQYLLQVKFNDRYQSFLFIKK